MLERIDEIDWPQLSHAYGDASDVPDLLRDLAGGTKEERNAAIGELYGNIWHQGTVYEATAVAVPFLLEIVVEPSTPDKYEILCLLQCISISGIHSTDDSSGAVRNLTLEDAERRARARIFDEAAHNAVQQGFNDFARLMRQGDVRTRASAAFVLATLVKRADDVVSCLLGAIRNEPDEWCRGTFLMALSSLVKKSADRAVAARVQRHVEEVFSSNSSAFEVLSAGLVLLQLEQEFAVPRVLELARPRLVADRDIYQPVYWDCAGDLYSMISSALNFAPTIWLTWIVENLEHPDATVRATAMFDGATFCRTFRWGPAELAPCYLNLATANDSDVRSLAIRCLSEMGAVGVFYLEPLAENKLDDVRRAVGEALQKVDASRKKRQSWLAPAVPSVLPSVGELSQTLERFQDSERWDDREKVQQALIALGFHGAQGSAAVEQVRLLCHHTNPWTRVHAIRTLWKITGDSALVVPLLEVNLEPQPAVLLVLDCAKEIGHAASPMIPELRRIIDSDVRYFKYGSWDDMCELDEELCNACVETLQAIGDGR